MPTVFERCQAGHRPPRPGPSGFTLIELVVTLTLVSVLALVVVPLYQMTATRTKESELRAALRQVRTALDAYKAATDAGIVSKAAGESGYPPTLATLVEGVDTVATPMAGSSLSGNAGASPFGTPIGGGVTGATPPGGAANNNANTVPAHMVFLRAVPRDPFFEDQSVAPDQQWNVRAYGALPGDFGSGADVYDISSKSTATGLNGIAYKDW